MARAAIALGSNLERPAWYVQQAILNLAQWPSIGALRASSLYRTAPVGYADQPDFVNAAVCVETTLSPQALLTELLALERHFGRERSFANAPRTLDLDLLLYQEDNGEYYQCCAVKTATIPALTLPHPRMHERAFVLIPLAEIAADWCIPTRGSVAQCLSVLASEGVALYSPT